MNEQAELHNDVPASDAARLLASTAQLEVRPEPPKLFYRAKELAELAHVELNTIYWRHAELVKAGNKITPPMPDEWPLPPENAMMVIDFPAIRARLKSLENFPKDLGTH